MNSPTRAQVAACAVAACGSGRRDRTRRGWTGAAQTAGSVADTATAPTSTVTLNRGDQHRNSHSEHADGDQDRHATRADDIGHKLQVAHRRHDTRPTRDQLRQRIALVGMGPDRNRRNRPSGRICSSALRSRRGAAGVSETENPLRPAGSVTQERPGRERGPCRPSTGIATPREIMTIGVPDRGHGPTRLLADSSRTSTGARCRVGASARSSSNSRQTRRPTRSELTPTLMISSSATLR